MEQTPTPPFDDEDDWGQEVWDALRILDEAGVTPELYHRWTATGDE